nr:3-hydroxyacyl-CoA dehydrogenase [Solirubrobacterales bacterium]
MRTIGVVGAGTMGVGIAQLAAQAGARTLLHDPVEGATGRGLQGIASALERGVQRGRWSTQDSAAARGRLEEAPALEDLAPCELVIEAAPENLELKAELFTALAAITDGVLASNTSSIPITAIGGACGVPERVVGMHFFNPPAAMGLLELIAGQDTSAAALDLARAVGEAMGKRVVDAADGPGFLVNRCNRPFGLEAYRLAQERLATPEQIDRICRLGGGFRMGPFELADLVGIDTGFAVSQSFYELSYGEPRWRPSPLAARMVAAGRHGRKTGRGWYAYDGDGPHRPED